MHSGAARLQTAYTWTPRPPRSSRRPPGGPSREKLQCRTGPMVDAVPRREWRSGPIPEDLACRSPLSRAEPGLCCIAHPQAESRGTERAVRRRRCRSPVSRLHRAAHGSEASVDWCRSCTRGACSPVPCSSPIAPAALLPPSRKRHEKTRSRRRIADRCLAARRPFRCAASPDCTPQQVHPTPSAGTVPMRLAS
jgi:hypothetical protein